MIRALAAHPRLVFAGIFVTFLPTLLIKKEMLSNELFGLFQRLMG